MNVQVEAKWKLEAGQGPAIRQKALSHRHVEFQIGLGVP